MAVAPVNKDPSVQRLPPLKRLSIFFSPVGDENTLLDHSQQTPPLQKDHFSLAPRVVVPEVVQCYYKVTEIQ